MKMIVLLITFLGLFGMNYLHDGMYSILGNLLIILISLICYKNMTKRRNNETNN